MTHALIAAVAHQLWEHCGGDEPANWLEAERFIGRLAAGVYAHSAHVGSGHDGRKSATSRSRRAEGQRRAARAGDTDPTTGPIPNY